MSSSTSSKPPNPPVVIPSAGSGKNIIVNPAQRLNPVLEHIRNVGKEFGDILSDYQVGRTTGVLFLSLKYHRLHPEYIHQRIERLGHSYSLRILLLMCDVSEHQEPIRELTKVCLINNITIIVAWSPEEAGMYLSTFKQFEHRPPDMIKERVDKDYFSVLRNSLTSISKVNKTDVETLRTSFGSFARIACASSDQLQKLPGFGQVKVRRIKDAFEKPFRHHVTDSVPTTNTLRSVAQSEFRADDAAAQTQIDEAYVRPSTSTASTSAPRPPRPRSPDWDMEFDSLPIDDLEALSDQPGPRPSRPEDSVRDTAARRKRSPSPIWDLELDLNPSDEEGPPPKKRPKGPDADAETSFGSNTILTNDS
ncbi:DNA repair protein rad10 [Punctularia strigosozonata HHB-11173 SS5]|uniref:DNA repair protein rad10 n=1 Tax=Punctularia strigosozonata (strain HHB-11173) TaxID=741275 RepID=UPI00044186CD|nr:DNA repair protein rad10 [Punctularia strigosozonata HHB-11173 SS5]EIN11327.1 DNA repair protein rad10 [Punctularia strigosozonata HHB-11173 SS5]